MDKIKAILKKAIKNDNISDLEDAYTKISNGSEVTAMTLNLAIKYNKKKITAYMLTRVGTHFDKETEEMIREERIRQREQETALSLALKVDSIANMMDEMAKLKAPGEINDETFVRCILGHLCGVNAYSDNGYKEFCENPERFITAKLGYTYSKPFAMYLIMKECCRFWWKFDPKNDNNLSKTINQMF